MASSLIPAQERRKEARGVGETETGLVLTAARYPRERPVIPARETRHTRARRGYLAEFCTESRMASSLIPAQERRKEARGVGETETGLVLTAARYPRQARV